MSDIAEAGSTIARAMDEYTQEQLFELFTMPGWDILINRLQRFNSEYAARVMTANRTGEANDRYEVGRYDGVSETHKFLQAVIDNASPSRR